MKKLNGILDLSLKLVLVFGLSTYMLKSSDDRITELSYRTIDKINPASIMDDYTLMSDDAVGEFTSNIIKRMIEKQYILLHPQFGPVINQEFSGKKEINILIESGGGSVDLGKHVLGLLTSLKQQNVTVNCYVTKSMSMAFHILVTGCDNRISVGDVELMSHSVYYGGD